MREGFWGPNAKPGAGLVMAMPLMPASCLSVSFCVAVALMMASGQQNPAVIIGACVVCVSSSLAATHVMMTRPLAA